MPELAIDVILVHQAMVCPFACENVGGFCIILDRRIQKWVAEPVHDAQMGGGESRVHSPDCEWEQLMSYLIESNTPAPLEIYPSTDLPVILQLTPFISWVDSFVLSQVAGLWERQATYLAFIWLLPRMRMRPHVPSQAAGIRERPAACLTHIRLLPRMRPHVLSRVADAFPHVSHTCAGCWLLTIFTKPTYAKVDSWHYFKIDLCKSWLWTIFTKLTYKKWLSRIPGFLGTEKSGSG